jgi:nucleotide-binding universal stress UspA family protein
VLGQQQPDEPPVGRLPPGFVSSVLIASGRPALVVPYAGEFAKVGDIVLVAWKPTPESARALKAALPLMQAARHVHVVAWGDPPSVAGQAPDIGSYLKLHDIDARVHWEGEETPRLGEMLLSRAADYSADLLVMGCYGHSRAREFVLGGVSRTVLASMTVPVLMSR